MSKSVSFRDANLACRLFEFYPRGLSGTLFVCPAEQAPRAAILTKGLDATLMPECCTRDLVAIRLRYSEQDGSRREIVLASAYFPGDSRDPPPPAEVERLVELCRRKQTHLLLGCDANSHHVVWGSTDTNARGDALLEYLTTTDLEILNRGDEPTFQTVNRTEVLDLTLCSRGLVGDVVDWRVSKEPSLSDHKHIVFRLHSARADTIRKRNPKKTSWGSYKDELKGRLEGFPTRYGTAEEIENAVSFLQRAMICSFENSCPLSTSGASGGAPWWDDHLQRLRAKVRKLSNRANTTKNPIDWDLYKRAQREYKERIRSRKKESWGSFCAGIEKASEASKLFKILARDPNAKLNIIQLDSGEYASSEEESLNHLMEVNFPGFERTEGFEERRLPPQQVRGADWRLASQIVRADKVKWAIGTFDPYKSPGADGIFPALLQEGLESILVPLMKVYRACIALGYTPSAWRMAKVVFIPKGGRANHTKAKDFRPISLTSFLLKGLERLVDRFLRDEVLQEHPLHEGQHAYTAGKSVETALHSAVGLIERQIEAGRLAVGTFIDIEGAFNSTSYEVVCRGAAEHGVPETLIRWIRSMLCVRNLEITHGGVAVRGSVDRGCPQGGVLSPLFWCLVVDGLLVELNGRGFYAQAYADDILILMRGPFIRPLIELTQRALKVVEQWCLRSGLSVNPEKTEIEVFTKKYKLEEIEGPVLFGAVLSFSKLVKYLGVYLDSKLSWKEHTDRQCRKFVMTFWMCRRAFGATWGLKPKTVEWLYSAILKPRLCYAAVVWWPRGQLKTVRAQLDRLRALVLRGISGAMRTTPVAAMGALLGIEPLHLALIYGATLAACRLNSADLWKQGPRHTRLPAEALAMLTPSTQQDKAQVRYVFGNRYRVVLPDRADWQNPRELLPRNGDIWYTDGSRAGDLSGAGVYGKSQGTEISIPLGRQATVFQAELYAILACARELQEIGRVGRRIRICSDSRAALGALNSHTITSKLVWACREALQGLTHENDVELLWVPGHSGIRGNEKADLLAGRGSSRDLVGPELVGIPACHAKLGLKRWLGEQHRLYWTSCEGCRQAKALLGDEPWRDRAEELLTRNRYNVRAVVQMLTGHCHLKYHQNKMGLTTDTVCGRCGEDDETSTHILCQCPALGGTRYSTLGSDFLEPAEIRSLTVTQLLDFWWRSR